MPCLLTYLLKYVPTGTYHTSVPCVCADMQYIPQLFHVYSPPSQNMSVIIRRDFFPDLPKLEMQLEYIRASEEGDFMRMKELSARMTHTPGPGQCTGSGPVCTCVHASLYSSHRVTVEWAPGIAPSISNTPIVYTITYVLVIPHLRVVSTNMYPVLTKQLPN